ncbi:MAG: hypothetical protein ACLFPI_04435 [Desulfobacterales bacterium]
MQIRQEAALEKVLASSLALTGFVPGQFVMQAARQQASDLLEYMVSSSKTKGL